MANKRRDVEKERFWRGALTRQAASGPGVRAFCRREKLTESAFYFWKRTISQRDAEAKGPRRRSSVGPARRPAFLPLVVRDSQRDDHAITIELVGGRLLRLPESITANRLAEVVHALEGLSSASGAQR